MAIFLNFSSLAFFYLILAFSYLRSCCFSFFILFFFFLFFDFRICCAQSLSDHSAMLSRLRSFLFYLFYVFGSPHILVILRYGKNLLFFLFSSHLSLLPVFAVLFQELFVYIEQFPALFPLGFYFYYILSFFFQDVFFVLFDLIFPVYCYLGCTNLMIFMYFALILFFFFLFCAFRICCAQSL